MEEFIKESENVEKQIEQFNHLSDVEIENFFASEKVSAKQKNIFIEKASSRINKLSSKIFISVSNWAENVEAYKINYFHRIEKMTYEEFVDLICNGIYEPTILIELTKTNIYLKYLQIEKNEQKRSDLQCLDIQLKLNRTNNTDLDKAGLELIKLLQNNTKRTEQLDATLDFYLSTVIENIDSLSLESNSIKISFAIMRIQMKQHKILTMKMKEFYLHARLKELNLKDTCKNVIVTLDIGEEDSEIFGYFTIDGDIVKGGTLKIYYEYLIKLFTKANKNLNISNNKLIDVININFLNILSHELGHVVFKQNFLKIIANSEGIEWLAKTNTNKLCNYHLRNELLKDKIGIQGYRLHHNIFIDEVQADIFSFFDSNIQFTTIFKDCYPQYIIENLVSAFAKRFVFFYKLEDCLIQSPMEKFDEFYKENIENDTTSIVTVENQNVWDSLITGDKIPADVLKLIKDIADGKIKTTNLYQTITDYIKTIYISANIKQEEMSTYKF